MATYNIGANFAVIPPPASAGKKFDGTVVYQPDTTTTRWAMLQPSILNSGSGGPVRPTSGIVYP